jgi:hypothetical protein
MKAIPISVLVLVAFPIHLLAQESNDFKPKNASYYAKQNFSPAKHIIGDYRKSDPKLTSFKEPVVVNSIATTDQSESKFKLVSDNELGGGDFKGGNFATLAVKPLALIEPSLSDRIALAPAAPLESDNSFRPFVASSPIQDGAIEITSPDVGQGLGVSPSQIVRPTPDNSASQMLDGASSQPSVSDSPVIEAPYEPIRSEEPQRDTTYAPQDTTQGRLVEPESVSLDHLRMSQQESWQNSRPNTMRHVTDHFSPGGEPFAHRGVVGDANYFGVDRRSCCDEWGFCNCNGGLKNNPGHLGIPWLRSRKDSCDAVNPVIGRHKAKCGCAHCQAAASDCGCGQ